VTERRLGIAAALMALCCLAAPAVLGAVAGAAIGSVLGVVAGVAVAVACVVIVRRLRAGGKAC
jgi:hypothetical protein